MSYSQEEFPLARIAQLVEQGIENPCVAGSNPAPGTIDFLQKNSVR